VNEDAIQFMAREKISHDFIVVDPEGPKQGPNPDLLDKAIYYPMVKAAHPYLANDGMILCHNILLSNPLREDKYFEKKIAYNLDQFSKFLPFMTENYQAGVWYDTTEGVGVFTHKK
jgi:spermidine synthase